MNILFISCGSSNPWAGPTYSIPKQVEAQSLLDNVFWYNLSYGSKLEFKDNVIMWKQTGVYHDFDDFPGQSLKELPPPFNSPDLIVIEQFYCFAKTRIRVEIEKSKIPYIIVPRGELTKQAQRRKLLKKQIANFLFMKNFAKKARAIQYLTKQEELDSGKTWNKRSLILSNGVLLPNIKKTFFNESKTEFVFIGRIEKYQKGLDLLVDACYLIKDVLKTNNCHVSIYGPDKENQLDDLKRYVKKYELDTIFSFYPPVFNEQKKKVLLESDVFLMPSRFEGHPTALIEALSYGLPCIVTTGSNMRQEIEASNAGWTADNNVESLANSIKNAARSRNELYPMGRAAAKLAAQYDWNNIASVFHFEAERMLEGL